MSESTAEELALLDDTAALPTLEASQSKCKATLSQGDEVDVDLLEDRLAELVQLANSMTEQLSEISDAVSRLAAKQNPAPQGHTSTKKKRTTKRRTAAG